MILAEIRSTVLFESRRLVRRLHSAAVGALSVVTDLRAHLRDESHRSHRTSYEGLRRAYVLTHGQSTRLLSGTVRHARRSTRRIGNSLPDTLGVAREVDANGCAVRSGYVDHRTVEEIRDYLSDKPGAAIGERFARTEYGRVEDLTRELKFEYPTSLILDAPHVLRILTSDEIVAAAFHYLRSEPIFAGLKAWWSLPEPDAPEEKLSGAAQLYHFDYDYPAFIKFFVYLTDVEIDDGPFTYIEGTHIEKPIWSDDRCSDQLLLRTYGLAAAERPLTGPAGTLVAADTSGFHKGSPVRANPRLILEVEYAVSRLGASWAIDAHPRALRPMSPFPHTFDLFCAPG